MSRIYDAYRPYGVVQKKDWGCWAACMQSWTSSVYYLDTRYYDSFVQEYGGAKDSLDTSSEVFGRLLNKYSLNVSVFGPKNLDMGIVHYALTHNRGYGRFAMLIEQLTPSASHARLIYNVDVIKDVIDVMEPRTGNFVTMYSSALNKTMLLSPVI